MAATRPPRRRPTANRLAVDDVLTRFADLFVPEGLRADPDATRRARVLVLTSVSVGLLLVAARAMRGQVLEVPRFSDRVFLAGCLLQFLTPPLLRLTGRLRLAGTVGPVAWLVIVPLLALENRGIETPVVMAFPALPLFLTFFAGARWGAVGTAVILGELALLNGLHFGGYPFPFVEGPPTPHLSVRAIGLGAVTLLVQLVAWLYEEQRLLSVENLRASEERYALASRGAHDGLWDWDLQRNELYLAPRWKAMLGYAEGDLESRVESWFPRVHPDDQSAVGRAFLEHFEGRTPHVECEHRIRHRDGTYRWVLTRGVAVRAADGAVTRIAGAQADVTERRKTQAMLLSASRMEAAATLAGGIAHDFNNLMAVVLTSTELLRAQLRDDPRDLVDQVDEIANLARRAGELAQQMLLFARGGEARPVRLDVNTLVTDTLELQRRRCPAGVVVEAELASALPRVEADPTQLRQVLMNLVVNACEAIETTGAPGRIHVETELLEVAPDGEPPAGGEPGRPGKPGDGRPPALDPGTYVVLSTSDTGCGMEPETLERIFEPFYTTKFQGRGLGMAAVYGIVQKHGGHVHARSEPGRGSRFEIFLPAAP